MKLSSFLPVMSRNRAFCFLILLNCAQKDVDDTGMTTSSSSDGTSVPTDGDAEGTDGGLGDLCEILCLRYEDCNVDRDSFVECYSGCKKEGVFDDSVCSSWWYAFLTCYSNLSCKALDNDGQNECDYMYDALDERGCFGLQCIVSVGQTETMCSVETICPDAPLRRVDCDNDGCICLIDQVVTKSCPTAQCSSHGVPSIDCCAGV